MVIVFKVYVPFICADLSEISLSPTFFLFWLHVHTQFRKTYSVVFSVFLHLNISSTQ